jgi:divalent metal cation (Fe/Co/Zn/Cd) transporter
MPKNKNSFSPFRYQSKPTVHWKDSREMNRVMHSLPGVFRGVMLELLDRSMDRHDIRRFLQRMSMSDSGSGKVDKVQLSLEKHLRAAQERGIVEERHGRYHLTPGGREMAEHMNEMIPLFMEWALSPETASLLTIWFHAFFSVLKVVFGIISHSAGLISDGIDTAMDTISSVLVWLGIKHNKERLVSIFIVLTMFASVGGVGLATYNKIIHPGPLTEGLVAFAVSALCGLVMLGISAYQYLVGKRRSNLAILCQAVDSRNHFLISMLVCGGILLSFAARAWYAPWLYYGDVVASSIIGLLILRGAIELIGEHLKAAGEPADVKHFLGRAMEARKEKIVFNWLRGQLQTEPLSRQELEVRFTADLCEGTPKILILSGMGYHHEKGADLHRYLDRFIEQKKIIEDGGTFWLVRH